MIKCYVCGAALDAGKLGDLDDPEGWAFNNKGPEHPGKERLPDTVCSAHLRHHGIKRGAVETHIHRTASEKEVGLYAEEALRSQYDNPGAFEFFLDPFCAGTSPDRK